MNNTLLTLLTIIGSAGCALTGILVNRHISLRQVKTAEEGSIITNAEYWRKEVETFKGQIEEMRKELEEAEKKQKETDRKVDEQQKDIELLTFKYYQVMVQKNELTIELERYKGVGIRENPTIVTKEAI